MILNLRRFVLPILLLMTVLMLCLVWVVPAFGDNRDNWQGTEISDVPDIASVPPPYNLPDTIQPIEPIAPVGADPTRCEMVQHCDSDGNCTWQQECR